MEEVCCESKKRGEIETRGVEGVVVCEAENICDEAEVDSNKGIRGPDNDSEERSSPDDEGERVCDAFEMSGASDEG